MPAFERLTPETQGFNAENFNRLASDVERGTAGYGGSAPRFGAAPGVGYPPRPDVFRSLMIQVSAVYAIRTFSPSGDTLYGYDWAEVVRLDGQYVAPGDGRSGTVYVDNSIPSATRLSFPAYEIRGSGNAPLNSGAQTKAYLAWISWDERSLEFLGLPPDVVSNVACVNGQIQVTKS